MPSLVAKNDTDFTSAEFTRFVIDNWSAVGDGVPPKEAVAVLNAHTMTETGGTKCWNWNFGNIKHTKTDGLDWITLHGVWEGVTPAKADQMINAGTAVLDTNPAHIAAVGPDKVAVVLVASFKAFPDVVSATRFYLRFLAQGHYQPCWQFVLDGDPEAFVQAIHDGGYFSASVATYQHAVRSRFDTYLQSSAYEDAIA